MTTIKTYEEGNRKSLLKSTQDGFFVMNTIGENASITFPHKSYKTINGAKGYIRKFLKNN